MAQKASATGRADADRRTGSSVETAAGHRHGGFFARTFWSLRSREFRLLWFGTLFNAAGQWIMQTSLGWLTYQVTGSAFLLGLVNGFRSVPLLVLAPFGGVAADRVDRKKLMFFTQMFLMTVTATFATVVLLGYARFWNISLFALLIGVGWAFNMPVRQSIIPALVPREDLQNAIALNSSGMNLLRIAGPSVAGLLIALVGVAGNFYVQASMYIGVAVMVWQLNVPPREAAPEKGSVTGNLAEGARFIWRNRQLRLQMAVALLPIMLGMPYAALMPVFAQDVLGVNEIGFGVLMAAPGAGALVGTLLLAGADNVKRRGLLLFMAIICMGLSLVAFSQSRWFAVSIGLLAVTGASQMIYMNTNRTMIQLKTPDAYRGRVMGIYMLNQGMQPLGALLAGTLAQFKGAPFATGVMGASVVFLAVLALLTVREVREA